jgi:hypothetical protein
VSNYPSLLERLAKVDSLEKADKLERSIERIYSLGFITSQELVNLDTALVDLKIKIETIN